IRHLHFDQAWFKVNRDRCSVFDSSGEIINIDVISKNRACIAVLKRNRRTGERNEGGIREGITQMACITIKIVVVAAVSLINDNNNVLAIAEQRMLRARVFFFFAETKFLQGSEIDPPGPPPRELRTQLRSGADLQRSVRQKLGASEAGIQLPVEFRTISHENNGGVFQHRVTH